MRKYFLLSAVALLSATTANATTDYAEVTAKATIEIAGTLECTDVNYGTIVLRQNSPEIQLQLNPELLLVEGGDYVISVSDTQPLRCDYSEGWMFGDRQVVELVGKNTGMKLSLIQSTPVPDESDDAVGPSVLTIPRGSLADTYEGSFTITVTY